MSYLLEDACIHLGYLTSRRFERNVKSIEERVQKPKEVPDDEDTYSSRVFKEFRAIYEGSSLAPRQAGRSRHHSMRPT